MFQPMLVSSRNRAWAMWRAPAAPTSFRLKTILGVAAIAAVLLAILIWSGLSFLRASQEDEFVRRAHTTATLFATTVKDAVLATDTAALESFVKETFKNTDVAYVRVTGQFGEVLAQGGGAEALVRPFRVDVHVDDVPDGVFDAALEIRQAGVVYRRVELGLRPVRFTPCWARPAARAPASPRSKCCSPGYSPSSWAVTSRARSRDCGRARGAWPRAIWITGSPCRARTNSARPRHSTSWRNVCARSILNWKAGSRRGVRRSLCTPSRKSRQPQAPARGRGAAPQAGAAAELIAEIQQTRSQLTQSEKMASIGSLAAGVAHEINNPVGYIGTNLGALIKYLREFNRLLDAYEAIEAQLPPDNAALQRLGALKVEINLEYLRADTESLVQESQEGVTRIKRIVQDLKEFSHPDEGEWQQADLHKGLDSTLNIVHHELKYKAELVKEYGELPPVECQPAALNQVFMNLLVNAAQAIKDFGKITLRTGVADDWVYVAVTDNGQGIAPDHLPRLFDPFFTTKPVGKGTGLGLSVSYGIVKKHHGRIEVESQPGSGTTFRVWLPVQQARAEPAVQQRVVG